MIKSIDSNYDAWLCPFCGGKVSGGSWTPDMCTECGAVEIMQGEWLTKKEYDAYGEDD